MKSGYLLIYPSDSDEVHINLITKDHYDTIVTALNNYGEDPRNPQLMDELSKAAWSTDPIKRWYTQTECNEPWPYNNYTILGTVSVTMC